MSLHRILSISEVSAGTCLIRFSREGLRFEPGQYLLLGPPGGDVREYSVYSSPHQEDLEILVRVIPEGTVSSQLACLPLGSEIKVQGVMGGFLIPPDFCEKKFLFVATGTGIAPFHSMVTGLPDLDYQLYHGVRFASECYARQDFEDSRYHACLSQENGDARDHTGRVTTVLRGASIPHGTHCYLCGSCDMIYEVFALLQQRGFSRDQIHTETYY